MSNLQESREGIPRVKQIMTIMRSAERIERILELHFRDQIVQWWRDGMNQENIADHLLYECGLSNKKRSAMELAVHRLLVHVIPDDERKEISHQNYLIGMEHRLPLSSSEYSRHGRAGGFQRTEEWRKIGVTANGSAIWTDKTREIFRELLLDPGNSHLGGAHRGQPDYTRLQGLLRERDIVRTIDALRVEGARLLRERNGAKRRRDRS